MPARLGSDYSGSARRADCFLVGAAVNEGKIYRYWLCAARHGVIKVYPEKNIALNRKIDFRGITDDFMNIRQNDKDVVLPNGQKNKARN